MFNQEDTRKKEYREKIINCMRNRASRLLKLIDFNAPGIILCNEIKLLNKMLPLLGEGYKHFIQNEAAEQLKKQKNKMGYCSNEDCYEQAVIDNPDDYDDKMCNSCYTKKINKDIDNEKSMNEYESEYGNNYDFEEEDDEEYFDK